MDIGEVAKKAKVTTATLRFYEEKGLIKSIGRQGLRRQYGKQVIDQLALIALGRAAGFSLNEIATMFGQDGKPDLDRQKLKDKAEQLEQMAKRLHFMAICIIWLKLLLHLNIHHRHTIQPRLEYKRHIP
ncbi:MerR family transcriptional regulator, partial [Acinetobacter baumannii]|uniref:MerR family transcriptional regulator n=1 Tax=Acinetobacter baumannii TaxID=470 RepID=UPI003AF8C69F